MRVRLATETYRLEFEGPPSVWNECLRPIFGGPEAPADPPPLAAADTLPHPGLATGTPPAQPAVARGPASVPGPAPLAPPPAAAVRTFVVQRPPREPRDAYRDSYRDSAPGDSAGGAGGRPEGQSDWRRRRGGPEPTIPVEPAADPDVLYKRLGDVDSRRAEKDAVLAAVWFLGRGQRDVGPEEVEKHLREHGGPPEVKVRPHMQKHITRTKLMEPGEQNGWVRLSAKGRAQIRLLVGE